MTDRPATEPRTEAGRRLAKWNHQHGGGYVNVIDILAIEREAFNAGVSDTLPVAEAAQGAAPRAEGLQYERGYKAGRRATEQDAIRVIGAMVEQAGGEIRVSHKYLTATDGDFTVQDDPDTMERVYRLRSRPSDERDPESEDES